MGHLALGLETSRELNYFRDGATLVISLDGLNWLFKRRCRDKEIKKRHCCFLEEPEHHSAFTSLASLVPKEAPPTRLVLNIQDIFSLITNTLNIVTQQDTVTTQQHNRFIIFCDEDIPLQLFGDTCYTEDCGTSIGETGWQISDNNMWKNSSAHWPHGTNSNNFKGIQRELVIRDNLNTRNLKRLLKLCHIYEAPGILSGRKNTVKERKSVSFDDDVTVYLFDQESPTLEKHCGPHTFLPSNYSCNLPDVTLEDSGLEWEDDFSALEKNCHFQCVRPSVSQHYNLSPPTQSCTALSRPERFFLSQSFLFLTHVTESDLEL